jgi:hypothetical protein
MTRPKVISKNSDDRQLQTQDFIATKITRLPPNDFDFRKRPIGNSG